MNLKKLKHIIQEEIQKLEEQRMKGGKPAMMGPAGGAVSPASSTGGGTNCPYEAGGTYDLGSGSMITLSASEASNACRAWAQGTNNGTARWCWSLCQWVGCAIHYHHCTPCGGCVIDPDGSLYNAPQQDLTK